MLTSNTGGSHLGVLTSREEMSSPAYHTNDGFVIWTVGNTIKYQVCFCFHSKDNITCNSTWLIPQLWEALSLLELLTCVGIQQNGDFLGKLLLGWLPFFLSYCWVVRLPLPKMYPNKKTWKLLEPNNFAQQWEGKVYTAVWKSVVNDLSLCLQYSLTSHQDQQCGNIVKYFGIIQVFPVTYPWYCQA